MKQSDLFSQIALGEDSKRQFKAYAKNADFLASEMADFPHTGGMESSVHADPTDDLLSMEPAA